MTPPQLIDLQAEQDAHALLRQPPPQPRQAQGTPRWRRALGGALIELGLRVVGSARPPTTPVSAHRSPV